MEQMAKIDELLEKTCYVIDFIPEQVKPDAGGQFFDVEDYLLKNTEKIPAPLFSLESAESALPLLMFFQIPQHMLHILLLHLPR